MKIKMGKETFESIREKGLLLYEYVRGSQSHGTETPESDIDTGGVYMCPIEQLLGLGLDYQEQIEDEKHDNVWFELNKFMNLLLKSNPTMLESLFIPDRCVIYEHPIITELKKHRNLFITKECFKPFGNYAVSQIAKAQGYNKMCIKPLIERRQPLDFAYTFRKQGSTKVEYWLEHRGLMQRYCGLVNISNMDMMYGVFYDWGNHFLNENVTYEDLKKAYCETKEEETIEIVHQIKSDKNLSEDKKEELNKRLRFVQIGNMARFICEFYNICFDVNDPIVKWFDEEPFKEWFDNQKPIGYKGMIGEDGLSNELRLSSVAEGIKPICQMHYDKDKYSSHCRDYRKYQEWVKNRNENRFNLNKGYNFDAKNMSECFRLINMCIEIAKGEGVKVDRRDIDREFLLDIKNHKYTYDELMEMLLEKKRIMEEEISKSTIPDKIDITFVNNLLFDIRKKQIYKN